MAFILWNYLWRNNMLYRFLNQDLISLNNLIINVFYILQTAIEHKKYKWYLHYYILDTPYLMITLANRSDLKMNLMGKFSRNLSSVLQL